MTSSSSSRSRKAPLRQARLAGANYNPTTIHSAPSSSRPTALRQTGLAAFGFGSTPQSKRKKKEEDKQPETPLPPKKKKQKLHLDPDEEIAETQFAQQTQSPESEFVIGSYSSPLSSPPPIDSFEINPFDIVYRPATPSPPKVLSNCGGNYGGNGDDDDDVRGMPPPPPPPITPTRRRVLEVPSSHSPPVTPISPYNSQQNMLSGSPVVSPSRRLEKQGMGPPAGRLTRFMAAGRDPLRDLGDHESSRTVVKSSQWWENEEGAYLETQVGNQSAGEEGEKDEKEEKEEQQQEDETADSTPRLGSRFRVDLSYERARSNTAGHDLFTPQASRAGTKRKNSEGVEESFHTPMSTFPPPPPPPQKSHNDSLEPAEEGGDDENEVGLPRSGQEEHLADDDYIDNDNDGDDYVPEFRPVRTQQLPSSYYVRHSSPLSEVPYYSSPPPSGQGEEKGQGRELDKEEEEDEDSRGRGEVTMSQLLSNTLMESFPMPPPLTQYSSYYFESEDEME